MKSSISPRHFLCQAIEIYSCMSIKQFINCNDQELILKSISFGVKELSEYYGYKITTKIHENLIYFYIENNLIYSLNHSDLLDLNKSNNESTYSYKLILHWGNILRKIERIGLGNNVENCRQEAHFNISLAI